jgi:hypothetical protein
MAGVGTATVLSSSSSSMVIASFIDAPAVVWPLVPDRETRCWDRGGSGTPDTGVEDPASGP